MISDENLASLVREKEKEMKVTIHIQCVRDDGNVEEVAVDVVLVDPSPGEPLGPEEIVALLSSFPMEGQESED